MVILPLQPQNSDCIEKAFKTFFKEWKHVENQISSSFYLLYLLKSIVDTARFVRAGYSDEEYRAESVKTFRHSVYEKVGEVANFCELGEINFERMLCSLLVLGRCLEGLLHDLMTIRMEEKEKEYEKLPVKMIEHVYAAVDVNIPSEYIFTEETKVIVLDCVNEETYEKRIDPSDLDGLNSTHSISKGTYLYDLLMKNNTE